VSALLVGFLLIGRMGGLNLMRNTKGFMLVGALAASATLLQASVSNKEQQRIQEAATVIREIRATPDKDIPQQLWDDAECVLVVPGLKKAAFIVGGEYGKGLMSCRHDEHWSPPVFMEIGKGSWGLQIGAQSVDLVLLVMNRSGMDKLLGNKVTLGAEASVAAGPVGRDARAATDVQLKAEILSYSRTQGLFAGVNVTGGVIRTDPDDTLDLYGKAVTPRDVLMGGSIGAPPAARPFLEALRTTAVKP
jgi:SH3 domain-containing YSC84-like protein 1